MNVVDSSGWLEYFADAENAAFFESAIEDVGLSGRSYHQSLRKYSNACVNNVEKMMHCRQLLKCNKGRLSN